MARRTGPRGKRPGPGDHPRARPPCPARATLRRAAGGGALPVRARRLAGGLLPDDPDRAPRGPAGGEARGRAGADRGLCRARPGRGADGLGRDALHPGRRRQGRARGEARHRHLLPAEVPRPRRGLFPGASRSTRTAASRSPCRRRTAPCSSTCPPGTSCCPPTPRPSVDRGLNRRPASPSASETPRRAPPPACPASGASRSASSPGAATT